MRGELLRVELKDVQAFVRVARDLSFTRAGAAIFSSQSAVSRRVNHLERTLDLRLFERSSRGVRLTDAGRALLPVAEIALAAAGRMEAVSEALRTGAPSPV